jgi:hypothetical protein
MAAIDAELRTIHTVARRVIERAAVVRQELPHEGGVALEAALKLASDAESIWRHASKVVDALTRERKAAAAAERFEEQEAQTAGGDE